jgi:GT2 family glycosyltransferase
MRVIFCLPGNQYSGHFLNCWTDLIAFCISNGIQPILVNRQSPNIYYVRNMCLGADVRRGPNQKPFNGEIQYDYFMWIDSDISFKVEHFVKLINAQKDIASGLYLMANGTQFATVEHWDEKFFSQNGYFDFITPQTLQEKTELFPVAYTGFGFILIKNGVFEKMEYPWFRPEYIQIGNSFDFTMEDVAFCLNARKKGFQIFIDPTVIVGHEKTRIL